MTATPSRRRVRHLWVVAHRWAGLTIAVFLLVASITGMVLPFEQPLTFATRPSLSRAAAPFAGARTLDGIAITQCVERELGVDVAYVPLRIPRDHVVRMFVTARAGHPPIPYDVVWADPYSGAVRLTYRFGGVRDGPENIVPFLYALHYGFVAGPWGVFAFGIAALIWSIDCFIGFYLTLPVRQRDGERRTLGRWMALWRPAWRVRRANRTKLNFDLHRASGLWLWPMLFVFAWSGVGLALPEVEQPVMRTFGATDEFAPALLAAPLTHPLVDRRAALVAGMDGLRRIGGRDGFTVGLPEGLSYTPGSGTYRIFVQTSLDKADDGGRTTVWIDGRDARVRHFDPPFGRTKADAFMQWLYILHMAEVFGLPYRIAVMIMGAVVATLTTTGILIWMRRRAARHGNSARAGVRGGVRTRLDQRPALEP